MAEYTLTVLDTPSIQNYIFGSNRLQENIGASELVWRAAAFWPLEALQGKTRTNVADPSARDPAQRLNDLQIEQDGLDAEVLYVGGGNALILFAKAAQARNFVTKLHSRLLQETPGLNLAAAHIVVDWERDHLRDKVADVMQKLSEYKQSSSPHIPLLGQSVTAECRSTGLAATTTNAVHGKPPGEETYPISSSVAAKLDTVQDAEQRLWNLTSEDFQRTKYNFPRDFDDFGRTKGEMSYIAVVHADGNGMGAFFRQIAQSAKDSRSYIENMRSASVQVEQASQAALRRLVDALVGTVGYDDDGRLIVGDVIPLQGDCLPFRPLVFGGDDVTFVCDGRLGLSLAVRYLEFFEEETAKLNLSDLHACAGVAVVKAHYPFARAYQLSEKLAGNAKAYVREEQPEDFSALDWHFAASGLLGDIQDDIRPRQYTVPLNGRQGKLYMRPVRLKPYSTDWRTWPNYLSVLQTFKKQWSTRRNKALALREALREGPEAVQRFLTATGHELPVLDESRDALQKTGWFGDTCGYFDAIEALDFYVPL